MQAETRRTTWSSTRSTPDSTTPPVEPHGFGAQAAERGDAADPRRDLPPAPTARRVSSLRQQETPQTTSFTPSPGVNLRVVADLITDAVQELRDPGCSIVIQNRQIQVVGATAEDLLPILRAAATRHCAEKDRFGAALKFTPLANPEADEWLRRWSEAGVLHEQALLLLDQIRSQISTADQPRRGTDSWR